MSLPRAHPTPAHSRGLAHGHLPLLPPLPWSYRPQGQALSGPPVPGPAAPRSHRPAGSDSRGSEHGQEAAPGKATPHSACRDQDLLQPIQGATGPAPCTGLASPGPLPPSPLLPHPLAPLPPSLPCRSALARHPLSGSSPQGGGPVLGSGPIPVSHLPGGQVEWVQGARPQLFSAASAPKPPGPRDLASLARQNPCPCEAWRRHFLQILLLQQNRPCSPGPVSADSPRAGVPAQPVCVRPDLGLPG